VQSHPTNTPTPTLQSPTANQNGDVKGESSAGLLGNDIWLGQGNKREPQQQQQLQQQQQSVHQQDTSKMIGDQQAKPDQAKPDQAKPDQTKLSETVNRQESSFNSMTST
jgi:hypothetical protein